MLMTESRLGQVAACDVGGTFTDLVVLDETTGTVAFAKAPTVPERPAEGLRNVISKSDLSVPATTAFLHGTTLGINTVLEKKGARPGLIATKGYRDVLEIARMWWPTFAMHYEKPAPLIPRYLCKEVTERLTADGEELQPVDDDEVRRAVADLIDEGVEAIAVCLLNAYAHPQHETHVGQIIRSEFPNVAVTLSHEVSREYREYERAVTTVIDATIRKRMADYIDELDGWLGQEGFDGGLFITRCDGGVMSAESAQRRPVRTLISGPASGVMGCVQMSRWLDLPNVIGIDMGGTSFEASIITDGEAVTSPRTELHGFPVLVPVVELATIGAGGGSIAWIDSAGALEIGPHSAGADPGPICYGNGGTEPTVTDAALVSGLLSPHKFLGGDLELDLEAARSGIQTKIAEPLGVSVTEASTGVLAVAQVKMAATLEEVTLKKGFDPRRFTLLAYGGGGPLVACALAEQLEVPRVLVPTSPGTFSAWGALTLDVVHDFSATAVMALDDVDPEELRSTFARLCEQGDEELAREAVSPDRRTLLLSIDMRYDGQEHVLSVPVGEGLSADLDPRRLRAKFDARHSAAYGYTTTDPTEVTTYRVRAVGALRKPQRGSLEAAAGEAVAPTPTGSRQVSDYRGGGVSDYAIYDRALLKAGHRFIGPAIVDEATSTTVVPETREVAVDNLGNLVITAR
jgi:N-methylhydantoinase A